MLALGLAFALSGLTTILPGTAAAEPPVYGSTEDFDAGTKDLPGDGNYGVETRTDNPAIPPGVLQLASLMGDSFSLADGDADTFKWDVPGTCSRGRPSTFVREIAGGVLRLGSNRAKGVTNAGVVAAAALSGDLDVRAKVREVATDPGARAALQLLDENRCVWAGRKSADGVAYEWDEGPGDASFTLRALLVKGGSASVCGTPTTIALDPVHLRIVRSGTTWSWYYSADGGAWTLDERCVHPTPGAVFASFMVTDPAGGVASTFEFDDYHVAAGTFPSGGFRTAGHWTSPSFDVPSGMSIDRVEVLGTFTPTYALDRVEIRRAGTAVATFEDDNALSASPAARVFGSGLSIRLDLKGDGRGSPVLDEVRVVLENFYLATTEVVTIGASTGVARQAFSDDLADAKTEDLGGVEAVVPVDRESIHEGVLVAGEGPPSPSDVDASDDVSVMYRETGLLGAALYKQGTFARKTDGPGVQTVTGIGFQGKALLLYWTRQSAFGTRPGLSVGIGFAASPDQQYAIAWADDDDAIPSNSGRMSDASAILILGEGTPTVDGQARFLGFSSDGMSFAWTTNPDPAQATIIHYIVLGGSVRNAFVGQFVGPPAGVTGLRSYTGVGFRGDAAIFLGSLQAALGAAPHATMAFGAATGPSNQGAVSLAIPDGTTTADTEEIQDNRRALIMYDPALAEPTTDQVASFASFDADGFTLNHAKATSGGILFWALILQGGDYKVDVLTRPAATGVQAVTGVGFRPDGVLFWGTAATVAFGREDPGAEFVLGAGSDDGSVVSEAVTWSGSNDRVSPSNANMYSHVTKVIKDLSLSSQGVQNEADYTASDPDGFRLTWTRVQSSLTQRWFYLAMRVPGGSAALDVEYEWTSIGYRSGEDALVVEGRRSTEDILVQVFDWTASAWTTRLIISSSEDMRQSYALAEREVSGTLSVRARFIGSQEASDFERSDLWLDYVAIEKREYRLDVVNVITGLAGSGPFTLRIEGRLSAEGENFDVFVWDWVASAWTLWLDSRFGTEDRTFEQVLLDTETIGGAVRVRFADDGSLGVFLPGTLLVDLLEAESPSGET